MLRTRKKISSHCVAAEVVEDSVDVRFGGVDAETEAHSAQRLFFGEAARDEHCRGSLKT